MAVENDKDVDIQDIFDSLVLSEDTFVKAGYQQGFEQGEIDGYQEGFQLGQIKGKEIGSEISFYRGFAKGFIAQLKDAETFLGELRSQLELNTNSIDSQTISTLQGIVRKTREGDSNSTPNLKHVKALQKLLEKISEFPQENIKDEDFAERLRDIRARFKHCCSLLKVDTSYSSEHSINF